MRLPLIAAALIGLNGWTAYADDDLSYFDDIIKARNSAKHLRYGPEKRQYTTPDTNQGPPDITAPGFASGNFVEGEPIDATGRGAPLSGGRNPIIDKENPSNLGQESTDNGMVVNLKWRFGDSKTRLVNGGFVREQLITDLPASTDIAAAQFHLKKGAVREPHWHRVAEWGFVYAGSVMISAVDENGKNLWQQLNVGDVWYFPKGQAHSIEGLSDQNEFLLAFDDGNFEAPGTTFHVDDWITHTPKHILSQNFGLSAASFATVPSPNPYISAGNGQVKDQTIQSPNGQLSGDAAYFKLSSDVSAINAPGGGGTIQIFDSTTFPISTTIAAAVITIKPGALREMHWHPTAEEWAYVVQGQARATCFIGGTAARTFDFTAGDTAVFPDNSGHYVMNTSNDTDLVWLEIFKADRIADISLNQWLALMPPQLVAQVLNVSSDTVSQFKGEKQYIVSAT